MDEIIKLMSALSDPTRLRAFEADLGWGRTLCLRTDGAVECHTIANVTAYALAQTGWLGDRPEGRSMGALS